VLDDSEWDGVAQALKEEIPELVETASGIPVVMRKKPFTNPQYLQGRLQYRGPVSMNTVKLEISREMVVGEVVRRPVPQLFDYPRFSVTVYTLENILAEKIRALVERGKAKDYYDVWRLLKVKHFEGRDVRNLVLKKCESKDVKFTGLTQIFPDNLPDVLKSHMKHGLTRLSPKPLPGIETIVAELKDDLGGLLD
jgi:predicted nucleotidyltransferase component of viral defense system